MQTALYPGTFDPMTHGHLDIMERALRLFDSLIVAVAVNPYKHPLFTVEERVEMIQEETESWERIRVEPFDGLLIEYAHNMGAQSIIRGLRAVSDFEYEFQMALTNRSLDSSIETVFLMPSEQYTYLNSTIVKEIAHLGGNVSQFVPKGVERRLREKLPQPEHE
ncbi:MAG: pantetheine-phosphate adenylyltransferase [Gemmatimonadota bacterium]|nr:MAG: pantetheine-phosphate adenylyltransferase [Gemmatimonadota bacterium]